MWCPGTGRALPPSEIAIVQRVLVRGLWEHVDGVATPQLTIKGTGSEWCLDGGISRHAETNRPEAQDSPKTSGACIPLYSCTPRPSKTRSNPKMNCCSRNAQPACWLVWKLGDMLWVVFMMLWAHESKVLKRCPLIQTSHNTSSSKHEAASARVARICASQGTSKERVDARNEE
ncbi:hypothetical protein B0H13DRAFT_1898551 [Mycena leptocephala]|nr:hypothetical protein B0H13DRAFT_1898551 [Mycena leptocephala]